MSGRIRTAALAVAVSLTIVPAGATTAFAAAKPNLRACYDGNCKISITKKVSFRIDPGFGFTRLTLSFNAGGVYVKSSGPGVSGSAYFSGSGSVTVNGITVHALSLSGRKAVLRLTTG
ncbi:hypothetical protein ACFYY8_18000 [Streptosporangium sp. NPDC001559]|uniref:hypothetical protein n=1 Tax=Streptosporangium sp. NPDC001559 TaxID=3366187 RepID=UPI0036F06771